MNLELIEICAFACGVFIVVTIMGWGIVLAVICYNAENTLTSIEGK